MHASNAFALKKTKIFDENWEEERNEEKMEKKPHTQNIALANALTPINEKEFFNKWAKWKRYIQSVFSSSTKELKYSSDDTH